MTLPRTLAQPEASRDQIDWTTPDDFQPQAHAWQNETLFVQT